MAIMYVCISVCIISSSIMIIITALVHFIFISVAFHLKLLPLNNVVIITGTHPIFQTLTESIFDQSMYTVMLLIGFMVFH